MILFLTFSLFSSVYSPSAHAADPHEIDNILSVYEAAVQSIQSYDITFDRIIYPSRPDGYPENIVVIPTHHTSTAGNTRRFRQQYVHDFSRELFRNELTNLNGTSIASNSLVSVWNGTSEKYLSVDARQGSLNSHPTAEYGTQGSSLTLLYKDYKLDYSYVRLFRSRSRDLITVEHRDGLIILFAPPELGKRFTSGVVGVRLYLNPSRGYLPEKIDHFVQRSGKLLAWRTYKNALAEVQPSIWFPIASRKIAYSIEPDSGKLGAITTYSDIFTDPGASKFNDTIPSSRFALDFPPGIRVYDNIAGTVYETGDQDRQKHIRRLAVEGRLGLEKLKTSGTRVAGTDEIGTPLLKTILFLVNGLLIALFVIVVCLRRIHRRPPMERTDDA